ncbi:sensor histidine kinase [Streptomyces sp. KL116D]|uniref:sensor histidine kinase n=1 Tax=Streptomyces sp. KL116D TaxID=3045152 RepID=UPI0035580FEA
MTRPGAAATRHLPLLGALVLTVIALAEPLPLPDPARPTDLAGLLALTLAATVPLAFVRAQPLLTALALTTATLLAPLVYHRTLYTALVTTGIALFLVGLRHPARTAVLFAVPYVAFALISAEDVRAYGMVLLTIAAAALGAGSARRANTEAADRTAADHSYADTALAHAALGERARIARELHDIVAHHVSTISVQAETARYTTPGLSPEGAATFLAIGDTARLALTEMRRLLGVLREDLPAHTPAARAPQPGLAQLVALVDEARETSGGAVRLLVRGRVTPLDPGLELTAYRIVQEALTNTRRHAPGVAVDVELDYRETELRLRIRDCGPGPGAATGGPGGTSGHGLLGMRERTAMAGGTLAAGPGPAGGFVVEATLPLPAAPGTAP